MGNGAGDRMAHAHLPRSSTPGHHPQVAATVDGAASVALEPDSKSVGRPTLDRPREIEFEARRPTNRSGAIVNHHRAPPGGRIGPSRAPGRR